MEALPVKAVPPFMSRIAESISDFGQVGATTYHDLTARVFQTLIADRKFLATFYTLAESACLLAELAVERLDVDWSDRNAIEALRIADFACGTGTLLSAAQRAVYRRYRRAGGDDKDLHRALMERVLTGLDIMPAATHLACSMLSSSHPSLAYGESGIHTMPYGLDGGRTHIGALDLLDSEDSYSLFATGESLGGTESESRRHHFRVTVENNSCDLVIMNPPFTRPTNHEARHAEVPVPSFAGFNTSRDEQQAMGRKLKKAAGAFSSGHAGLASNFMDLGHSKLKDGGVLALVVPFAFVRGKSWESARRALKAHYSDIHVTSIAATGSTARAFSADTDMAECLVVGKRRSQGNSRAAYFNLAERPASLLEAAVEAKSARSRAVRGEILNGGPAGVRSPSVIDVAPWFGGRESTPTASVAFHRTSHGDGRRRGLRGALSIETSTAVPLIATRRDRHKVHSLCVPFVLARCRLIPCSGLIRPVGSATSSCEPTPAGIRVRATKGERPNVGAVQPHACTPT